MKHNTKETEIALYDGQVATGYSPPVTGAPEQSESLFQLVDDRLRGRWLWATILAVILGIGLGTAGYLSTHPIFRSDGAIRITPRIPVILGETPEHRVTFFSQFIATQIQLIKSRRVLENALQEPALAELPWTQSPEVLEQISEELIVRADRNSELISVSYEHRQATVTQAVVNSILHSYFDIYGSAEGVEVGRTLERLYQLQDQHTRDMRAIRQDIARIRTRHEASDLSELQTLKLERMRGLEDQLAAAEMALKRQEDLDQQEEEVASEIGPTPYQLEMIDPKLAEHRALLDGAEVEFEFAKSRYRSNSPRYIQAENRHRTAQLMYDKEYAKALALWEEYGSSALPGGGNQRDLEGFYAGFSPERLKQEIDDLNEQGIILREDIQQLIVDMQNLDDKEYEKESLQTQLDHTSERIQQLELNEESIVKRINIAQEGYLPRSPYKDSRKKRAAAGVVLGFILSFGTFFLLGTLDRRTYGTRQLKRSAGSQLPSCLGVLPELGKNLTHPESNEIAAHCVHQIRNQIEALRNPHTGYVLAISSPYQGDGKTSIAMALGWSYAAAGYNTLLIDCDLVGRSLTRQLGLIAQPGLKESIHQQKLNGFITKLPVENLSAIPAGIDTQIGPESLRRHDLENMYDQLRTEFEIIIIDTGPMLGSLESTPVAASADGVILSVRRGRSRNRLEECQQRLQTMGTRCLGVILNYAVKADCNRYVSEASLSVADAHAQADRASVIQTSPEEQNVLMLAMEHTGRVSEDEEESFNAAS